MPTFDDMSEMTFTEYVFQETLRFYPSVMVLNRRTTKRCSSCRIRYTSKYCCDDQSHPLLTEWKNGGQTHLEFDPMRFSPERAEHKKHGFSYIPFGGGAHKCIGMHFAMMNAKLYLFRLLKNYKSI